MACALVLAPLLASCASAHAKAKPADSPGLNVPPPPPHVIEPAPPPPPEPVSELPPPVTPAAPHASRPASPKPQAEPKAPEAKPGEPGPPQPEAPAPPKPQPEPAAQLRTPQTADTSAAARNVRATIDRAKSTLGTVNYGPLSNERKKAYNDAKLFIDQAEDALKQGNLVFAQGVATKAETLAKELAGR